MTTDKTYKIVYKDGRVIVASAENVLNIVRRYDLATKENIDTKIFQIEESSN